jgi:hypothetical protein
MRNKITLLFMLICGNIFAQPVPNTTTFTLQNVYDVVHGHTAATTGDLQSCFDNSVAAYFDATYGSKTMSPKTLYGFRNYTVGCPGLTFFYYYIEIMTPCGDVPINDITSAALACHNLRDCTPPAPGSVSIGYYSASRWPGEQLYKTNNCTDPATFTGYVLASTSSAGNEVIYIENGIIITMTTCN